MLLIITLSLIIFNCNYFVFGGILDCDNKYQSKHPETNEGAVWCADEGDGSCSGPGRIYYGSALTWTYIDLDYGETISCTNSAFDCDPLWAFSKKCYKKEKFQYVMVNFTQIKILKTADDGSNGDGVEEWDVYESDPGIIMNVDFIDPLDNWDDECGFQINELHESYWAENSDCKPPADTENSQGFYECAIGGYPLVMVTAETYENGLEYTFNFQIGDFDANNEFDDGPIFDITNYQEPDHKSITDLKNEDGSVLSRYFTRWDTNKNRRARLYLEYTLIESDEGGDETIINCS